MADVSETVLAGVDVAGGEDDVEAIVPLSFRPSAKWVSRFEVKMDGVCVVIPFVATEATAIRQVIVPPVKGRAEGSRGLGAR